MLEDKASKRTFESIFGQNEEERPSAETRILLYLRKNRKRH